MDARRILAAFLFCSLVATGCASDSGGLPIYDPGHFCMTAAFLPVRIEGDAPADPPMWGIASNGSRVDLMWPPDFTLRRTETTLEVVDSGGKVVAQQGELLVGAGGGHVSGEPDAPFAICEIGTKYYTSSQAPRLSA